MFYCKLQGFFMTCVSQTGSEMWRDWEMAHAGTWVTQHLKGMALVRNPFTFSKLASWIGCMIHGSNQSVSFHECKCFSSHSWILSPSLCHLAFEIMTQMPLPSLCHLRQMPQVAPFSFPPQWVHNPFGYHLKLHYILKTCVLTCYGKWMAPLRKSLVSNKLEDFLC